MEMVRTRKIWIDYVYIVVGCILIAISYNVVYEPMEMVVGGVTGLAIVIKSVTGFLIEGGIPLWLTNIVINIPLFILAIVVKGKDFGGRSLFATVILSLALYVTEGMPVLTTDLLLGSIFGAVISGVGLGLVFSAFSTTGGTDLAASLIQQLFKHVSVARIMMVLDSVIIVIAVFVFGVEKSLYAIVSVFIIAKVVDAILDGLHFSKASFIISDHYQEIAEAIFKELDRGVTGLSGEGMYTSFEKKVLLCVVSKREIVKVKELVKQIDRNAFIMVTDVREVLGEGFREYAQDKTLVVSQESGKK